MYHNANNFTMPDSFIPDRWLGDARFSNDCHEALQAFSYGPRNCIGKKLVAILPLHVKDDESNYV